MKKKKYLLMTVIIMLIIIAGIGSYVIWNKQKKDKIASDMKIVFQKDLQTIEYGAKTDSKTFVKSAVGKITSFPEINTSIIGKQTITYKLVFKGIEKDIPYEVEVKDTKYPIIELKKDAVTLSYGKEFHAEDNINKIYDPVDGKLKFSKIEKKGFYWTEGKVNTKKAGTYSISVIAEDNHGNKVKKSYNVIIAKKQEQRNSSDKQSSSANKSLPSSDKTKPYYVHGVLLVNKKHALPRGYGGTDATAYAALQSLQGKATSSGYDIPFISGYRSYDYQEKLYNDYVARDGQALADTYSARPGCSEHQTGLAFDIGEIDTSYGNTPAGKWLAAHCAQFGFILRYPAGKESITGYQYEPWHIRYVGVDIATQIMDRGITLEEYLGVS